MNSIKWFGFGVFCFTAAVVVLDAIGSAFGMSGVVQTEDAQAFVWLVMASTAIGYALRLVVRRKRHHASVAGLAFALLTLSVVTPTATTTPNADATAPASVYSNSVVEAQSPDRPKA